MPDDKLMEVIRDLSPTALRALVAELSKLRVEAPADPEPGSIVVRKGPRRSRS